jgi:hypothetical protein
MRLKPILCVMLLASLVMPVSGQETALAWNEMGNFLSIRACIPKHFLPMKKPSS